MVVDHGGEVVGVITAFIDRFWYSQDPVSFLQMWYVVPEHRRGLLGGLMIRHYVRWSKRQGARVMYAYTTAGIRTEATDALLRHAGFTRIGGSYRKET
jgi:GNAT superfamily N-acetyltransferase